MSLIVTGILMFFENAKTIIFVADMSIDEPFGRLYNKNDPTSYVRNADQEGIPGRIRSCLYK